MSLNLANKYRPKDFSDVVSQNSVVEILSKQITTNTHKNVYLLTGPAGTGKTTIARIMASKLNNGKGNPHEIDAASNSSVEDVRKIVEASQVKELDAYYKIYIIDECHSLSNAAWQAFLKCIEEPPTRTIFIFCTTDAQKIPATILSRVQRFDFKRIPYQEVVSRLKYICNKEGFTKFETSGGPEYIAKLADGGMRDAITMLDKCASYNSEITLENVVKSLGTSDYETMFKLINFVIDRNELETICVIDDLFQQGVDLKVFLNEFTLFILDITKYILKKDFDLIKIPAIYKQSLDYSINFEGSRKFYDSVLDILIKAKESLRWETQVKSAIQLYFLKMCRS